MPHRLSSHDSGSPPPSQTQSNHYSPELWESENDSYFSRSVYSPRPIDGDEQSSRPIMGYYPPVGNIRIASRNPSNHCSEVTQPSASQTPTHTRQQTPPQSSRFYHQTQSNPSVPWTPAPTTSDVHNRRSRSVSILSTASSSSTSQQPLTFGYSYTLSRFLTVGPTESPLAYEDRRAISEGFVQEGDDMFARRCEEQGWIVSSQGGDSGEQGGQGGSGSSRTLGRSRDGTTQ